MPGCSVNGCTIRDGSSLRLYTVSLVPEIREKWENYLIINGREQKCANKFFVCEKHFEYDVIDGHAIRRSYPSAMDWKVSHIVKKSQNLEMMEVRNDVQDSSSSTTDSKDSLYNALERRNNNLEKQLKFALKKIDKLITKSRNERVKQANFEKNLGKFFDDDQLEVLKGKKLVKWGVKSISKALYLRKKGKQTLEIVRTQIAPLPSITTCNRRIQEVKFRPGIINFNVELLAEKCKNLRDTDRNFALAFDEMAIIPSSHLDPSTKEYTGYVTLPPGDTLANEMCAFMIMGLTVRIKQVVAFHLTDKSCDGESMLQFINECICVIENNCNIFIRNLSFDLGSLNRSMLSRAGITLSMDNEECKISHPNRKDENLYLFPDATHSSKNLNQAFKNHGGKVSSTLKAHFNLSSLTCSMSDVEKLFKSDEKLKFPLAPELSQIVLHPNQWEKMDPKNATKFHSHTVTTAIDYKFQQLKSSKGKKNTTSFILENLNRLHTIMTSRSGWRIDTPENKAKYEADLDYLDWVSNVFLKEVKLSSDNRLPSVKGMRMAIKTLSSLSRELFAQGVEEFQASRLLTDAMENVFSVLRSLVPQPSAVQVSQSLRIYSISTLLFKQTTGVYYWDEIDDTIVNFLKFVPKACQSEGMEIEEMDVTITSNVKWSDAFANKTDFNSFVYFLAAVARQVSSKLKCIECHRWMFASCIDDVKNLDGYELMKMRSTLNDADFSIPSLQIVQFCLNLEVMLMRMSQIISPDDPTFSSRFLKQAEHLKELQNFHCEDFLIETSKLFVRLRIKMLLHRTEKHKANKFASKSMK